jgi:hypothetical protein
MALLHVSWLNSYESNTNVDIPTANPRYLLDDFVSFLGACQRFRIDFLPITWQPGLQPLGTGGQANINQSLLSLQQSFAFRRIKSRGPEFADEPDYCGLKSQIAIFGRPCIRDHMNIVTLEGVCWDIQADGQVLPVLVFEKIKHRDLCNFMDSDFGKTLTFDQKIKLCADIASGLEGLHSCRKYLASAYSLILNRT